MNNCDLKEAQSIAFAKLEEALEKDDWWYVGERPESLFGSTRPGYYSTSGFCLDGGGFVLTIHYNGTLVSDEPTEKNQGYLAKAKEIAMCAAIVRAFAPPTPEEIAAKEEFEREFAEWQAKLFAPWWKFWA